MKKRRWFSLFLSFALLLPLFSLTSADAYEDFDLDAKAGLLIEADTGEILYEKNAHQENFPASLTKVMVALLVFEAIDEGKIALTDSVTATESAFEGLSSDGSTANIVPGETMTVEQLLNCMLIVSANEACNVVAEYVCGSISAFVERMNTRAQELGCTGTHFANPHGISGDDHYTSCYDMAQILRWALTQPGFETIFTRLEMYTMAPTNVQPVTRYFSQQDKMRLSYSRYYIPAIRGSKIGYTNIARYSYVCLAEQNGVRLICVTMQSEMKTDKYNDVRTLLDYAFARYTGYTDLPSQGLTGEVEVVGGGGTLGKVTVTDPGVRLLLADGVTAGDVSVSLELPERYVLGTSPEVYAVYTVNGGDKQESTSVRVPAVLTGLDALLEANAGRELDTASDVKPARTAGMLIAISLACTAAAACATLCVMRVMRLRKTKKQKPSQH